MPLEIISFDTTYIKTDKDYYDISGFRICKPND
jgi:hypothetical protein